MRKKLIKVLSLMLVMCVLVNSFTLPGYAATDIPSEIYLTQMGSNTCTLSSAAMMLRARAYLSNNSNWSSITENSIKSTAWTSEGLRWSWKYSIGDCNFNVAHASVSGGMSINTLKSLLNSHPEGIVIHVGSLPHGVFLTDYEGDTFYCADTVSGYSGKRIALSSSYLGKKLGNQASILSKITAYWYVSSYSVPSNQHYDNPSIAGTYWGNQTDSTFRPVVVVDNPECVRKVRFAVWATGDQSDLKWYDANYNGAGGYFKDIDFNDFEHKIFICHVYVYGMNGSVQTIEMERLDVNDYERPNMKDMYWGNQTDSTFRPVVVVGNPEYVREVRFAVWTTGDQSDLKWYDANYNGAGGYFKDINFADFAGQRYFCHGYVYGKDGSVQSIAFNNFDTYNAQGKFENAEGTIGSVTITGYAFDKSDKNEPIAVHCYLKDSEGNTTFLGSVFADKERTDVNDEYVVGDYHGFEETFITSLSGTCILEVSAINIGGGNAVTFLGSKEVIITQPQISFDSCGGTKCASIKVVNGENYGTLPVPTRKGYIFEGWYTTEDGSEKITEDTIVSLMNHQTLYAVWAKDNVYTNPFGDVSDSAWYAPAVQYVYENGLMSGNNGLFKPTDNITRAQVVTTLYNMEGKPPVSDYRAVHEMKDVQAGQWYTDAICWAYSTGVVAGNTSTKMFNVSNAVTRQQLATMFYNYAEYKGFDIATRGDYSSLKGANEVASYAVETMKWAYGTGLITGSKTTVGETVVYNLNPLGTATRAQMATILKNFREANVK